MITEDGYNEKRARLAKRASKDGGNVVDAKQNNVDEAGSRKALRDIFAVEKRA